jgi:hypothetical protein
MPSKLSINLRPYETSAVARSGGEKANGEQPSKIDRGGYFRVSNCCSLLHLGTIYIKSPQGRKEHATKTPDSDPFEFLVLAELG